eukprot:COSAG06_NODE_1307_length_9916_cov_99.462361_13_plen_128_part_00
MFIFIYKWLKKTVFLPGLWRSQTRIVMSELTCKHKPKPKNQSVGFNRLIAVLSVSWQMVVCVAFMRLMERLTLEKTSGAMRFPLIRQNRSIFIGNLGLFWIYFYGLMGKRMVMSGDFSPRALGIRRC